MEGNFPEKSESLNEGQIIRSFEPPYCIIVFDIGSEDHEKVFSG